MNHGAPARHERTEHDPVTDGRELPPRGDLVAESASDGGQQVRISCVHGIDVLVLEGDAGRNEALADERLKCRRKSVVPSEGMKVHDAERSTAAGAVRTGRILRTRDGVKPIM
jgi:hypothetical protein